MKNLLYCSIKRKLLENDEVDNLISSETLDILLKIVPDRARTILPGMIILNTLIKHFRVNESLSAVAEQEKCLGKLYYLCRSLAITKVKNELNNHKLFINVDARILYDKKFHQGTTSKLLKKCHLDSSSIVFEISQKSAIEDYAIFRSILENYQCQLYTIAIDDVGSGYSGLNLLAQISPQFIKIDIGLIKNIDTDFTKKSIVKALVGFSKDVKIKTIAEGIEHQGELKELIKLGIDYGQGFYLGHPLPVAINIFTSETK